MAWTTPKTWTNSGSTAAELNTHVRDNMNETAPAIVTTKGDLVIADAANSLARLAVGTDGQILVADSGEATGWKWAAPPTTVNAISQFPAGVDDGAYSGTGEDSANGDFQAYSMSTTVDGAANWNVSIPYNFGTLTAASIYRWTSSAVTTGVSDTLRYVIASTSRVPNATTTTNDSMGATSEVWPAAAANVLNVLDVSAAFDGLTIGPGYHVGLRFIRDANHAADNLGTLYVGILILEYTEA